MWGVSYLEIADFGRVHSSERVESGSLWCCHFPLAAVLVILRCGHSRRDVSRLSPHHNEQWGLLGAEVEHLPLHQVLPKCSTFHPQQVSGWFSEKHMCKPSGLDHLPSLPSLGIVLFLHPLLQSQGGRQVTSCCQEAVGQRGPDVPDWFSKYINYRTLWNHWQQISLQYLFLSRVKWF